MAEVDAEQRRAGTRGPARRRAGSCRRRRARRPARSPAAASALALRPPRRRRARSAEVVGLVLEQPQRDAVLVQRAGRTGRRPRAASAGRCARSAGRDASSASRLLVRSRAHPLTGRPQVRGATYLGADLGLADRASPRAQPQEVLDVARRARAAGWWSPPAHPSRAGRRGRDRRRPPRPAGRVAHHAALADPLLAHLELRLDHQHQVAVVGGHADQRVEHQLERDERQVADDQRRPARRPAPASARGRWCGRGRSPASSLLQRPGELAVADVDRDAPARRRPAAARR